MPSYLIHCKCGLSHAVAERQAGSRTSCQCGSEVEIPPLSQLKETKTVQVAKVATQKTTSGKRGASGSGQLLGALGVLVSIATLALIMVLSGSDLEPDPTNMFVPVANGLGSLFKFVVFAIGSLASGILSIIGFTLCLANVDRGTDVPGILISLVGPSILVFYAAICFM